MSQTERRRPAGNGSGVNDQAVVGSRVRRDPDKARARIRHAAARELDAVLGTSADHPRPRSPHRYGLTDDELRKERGALAAGKVVPDPLDGWALRPTPPWQHREIDAVLVNPNRRGKP